MILSWNFDNFALILLGTVTQEFLGFWLRISK